ncbi:glycosyltransferase [Modestobacter sp. VKM Ac-2984]|uniref:glycosyltransferase n=1 Tax=Modestobacter sp. VKM Ac-2984 TaxID=3004138 RepID=UPI0022AB21F6|nr:glycosyltransferase [Modestobacter sp. VKM Ac-2984]MCZ2817366.1 glycosyltransferase [Modestobacter sp. VKM Ac-2984]
MSALLIATAGGHLSQLVQLAPRFGIDPTNATWVTVPTAQSETLLEGHDVVWATYSSPRDARRLVEHTVEAARLLRRRRFDIAVSTGSSLAPPFLAAARVARIPSHYVESATRVDGPSFTGRLMSAVPGVHLYTQHRGWAHGRWHFAGSVFDGWGVEQRPGRPAPKRVLVTVGSAKSFPFTSMIEAVRRVLPESANVLWQVGDADVPGLPGRVVSTMTAGDMAAEIRAADVVVSHAGTGSVLSCLQAGKLPVIVPRAADSGEHIDGHQDEIADMLAARGLAVVRRPAELQFTDLELSASQVVTQATPPPFHLR